MKASFFWSQYQEDLPFLLSRCKVVTVFTVLHILPSEVQDSCLTFMHSLLNSSGKLVVLHYMGRSEDCFKVYLKTFQEMKNMERWKNLLKQSEHKSLKAFQEEKKVSLESLLHKLNSSNFSIKESKYIFSNTMIIKNTWKVIFSNKNIQRQEFGKAYEKVSSNDMEYFLEDFSNRFEANSLEYNSHFCMILAEKQK